MSKYIDLVRQAVEIMEYQLGQSVTLKYICDELHISQFHFNRLFKAITGISPKKYMVGRTLSLAADDLIATDESIIDIALKWGFTYSEDFSRSFKRQFKMSPSVYRSRQGAGGNQYKQQPIRDISDRAFVNRSGKVELNVSIKRLAEMTLLGVETSVSTHDNAHLKALEAVTAKFIEETDQSQYLEKKTLYSLVKCEDDGGDLYGVYIGRSVIDKHCNLQGMQGRVIPEGLYASFEYTGRTDRVYEDFERDFYTWIVETEVVLKNVGINMISKHTYKDKVLVLDEILVPVMTMSL